MHSSCGPRARSAAHRPCSACCPAPVLDAIVEDLEGLPGVAEVHDLHAWTLTSGMNVATAHLVVTDGADTQTVLTGAQAALRNAHGIKHATLQVEVDPSRECHEATW